MRSVIESDDLRRESGSDGDHSALELATRQRAGGPGKTRRRVNSGVLSSPRVSLAVPTLPAPPNLPSRPDAFRTRRTVRPAAALEWQEVRLPLLGRLWAAAWLPSVLLAGCLVALMYLVQTSGVATTGYDIQRLQLERDDWQGRNEQLRFELAKRRSLTWIESEAIGRMGMVRAEPTALTYLTVSR